jgi:hypothetical protein
MISLDYEICPRCGRHFRQRHGNQRYCSRGCRLPRPSGQRWVAREPRFCELCGQQFQPNAWHAKYCSAACGERVRDMVGQTKYRGKQEQRRVWRARVQTGQVRCARGRRCRFAEMVDGEPVGGLIHPTMLWDVGHADGESAGGAEHRLCNRSAPMRLKARRGQ